jgi:Protein of unknown function (DUF1353)
MNVQVVPEPPFKKDTMNRFYNSKGDMSTQFSPWELKRLGFVNMGHAVFKLEKEIRFYSDVAGGDIVVPVGFWSDLASIPQIAWSIFLPPDAPVVELGGWVHDWLYSTLGQSSNNLNLTRKQCDYILAYESMPELGASKFQQYVVYYALRIGGASSFNDMPPQERWR